MSQRRKFSLTKDKLVNAQLIYLVGRLKKKGKKKKEKKGSAALTINRVENSMDCDKHVTWETGVGKAVKQWKSSARDVCICKTNACIRVIR